jgi:hypothetical protein
MALQCKYTSIGMHKFPKTLQLSQYFSYTLEKSIHDLLLVNAEAFYPVLEGFKKINNSLEMNYESSRAKYHLDVRLMNKPFEYFYSSETYNQEKIKEGGTKVKFLINLN